MANIHAIGKNLGILPTPNDPGHLDRVHGFVGVAVPSVRQIQASFEPVRRLRVGHLGSAAARRRRLRRTRFLLWDYAKKLSYVSTWRKIVSGRINVGQICKALVGQFGSARRAAGRAASHAGGTWSGARGPMLFVYGGNDPDAKAAVAHYGSLCRKWKVGSTFHVVRGANHSSCSLRWEKEVIDKTVEWIKEEVACSPYEKLHRQPPSQVGDESQRFGAVNS